MNDTDEVSSFYSRKIQEQYCTPMKLGNLVDREISNNLNNNKLV